ncbi:MAG: hypothetical protein P8L83_07990 [Flavobacteriaceae bacterium]|nr:hypothetical protein [Flavobacteriaceae bacterium]
MKKIFFTFLITILSFSTYGQDKRTYESVVYFNDIAASKVPRFIELHKKFTDMSLISKNRKITGEWLFRHWYGSGHTFALYQQYETMADYHKDAEISSENIMGQINATTGDFNITAEKEKEMLMEEWREYRAFSNGHTDEVRVVNEKTGFLTVDDVNFDVPFVMSVGKYNSSGSWSKLGDAFFDWRIKPQVDNGSSIAGGVSYHFMGSGQEVEVWQCYNSLVDFAKSASTRSQEESAIEGRKTFWSLVEGSHEDQIYLHIGNVNLEKGIFDLAGENR